MLSGPLGALGACFYLHVSFSTLKDLWKPASHSGRWDSRLCHPNLSPALSEVPLRTPPAKAVLGSSSWAQAASFVWEAEPQSLLSSLAPARLPNTASEILWIRNCDGT